MGESILTDSPICMGGDVVGAEGVGRAHFDTPLSDGGGSEGQRERGGLSLSPSLPPSLSLSLSPSLPPSLYPALHNSIARSLARSLSLSQTHTYMTWVD